MSNILRIEAGLGGLPSPPFVDEMDADLGGGSPTSNMLRMGDRGFVKGDGARPDVADFLGRPAAPPSSKARTSLRSSSNIDSRDIC